MKVKIILQVSVVIMTLSLMTYNSVHDLFADVYLIPLSLILMTYGFFATVNILRSLDRSPKGAIKLILSDSCNHTCSYCVNKTLSDIPALKHFNELDNFAEIHLTGGEPFHNKQFSDILFVLDGVFKGKIYLWTSFIFDEKFDAILILDSLRKCTGITYTVHDFDKQNVTIQVIMYYMDLIHTPTHIVRFKLLQKDIPRAIAQWGIKYNYIPFHPEIECTTTATIKTLYKL